MITAFRDLLAWLFGWKSAAAAVGPYAVQAGQVRTAGAAAGCVFTAHAAAGSVFTPMAVAGQVQQ